MGKSLLATVKTMPLPRLELNAAVVGVWIAQFIKKEMSLPLNTIKYWTNSTLTLQYITDKYESVNIRLCKVYVVNRVAKILEYTDTGDWQHIDWKMNPADMCTTGLMDPANLLQQDKHGESQLLGPDFLTEKHQQATQSLTKFMNTIQKSKRRTYRQQQLSTSSLVWTIKGFPAIKNSPESYLG